MMRMEFVTHLTFRDADAKCTNVEVLDTVEHYEYLAHVTRKHRTAKVHLTEAVRMKATRDDNAWYTKTK